jgi:hypothetical protein
LHGNLNFKKSLKKHIKTKKSLVQVQNFTEPFPNRMQLANPLLKNHLPKTNKKDPENAGKLHAKLKRKTAILQQVFCDNF